MARRIESVGLLILAVTTVAFLAFGAHVSCRTIAGCWEPIQYCSSTVHEHHEGHEGNVHHGLEGVHEHHEGHVHRESPAWSTMASAVWHPLIGHESWEPPHQWPHHTHRA